MDAQAAIKLVRRVANAYSTAGSDASLRGDVRRWVVKEELIVTRVLLRTLLGRTPTKNEVEDALSD